MVCRGVASCSWERYTAFFSMPEVKWEFNRFDWLGLVSRESMVFKRRPTSGSLANTGLLWVCFSLKVCDFFSKIPKFIIHSVFLIHWELAKSISICKSKELWIRFVRPKITGFDCRFERVENRIGHLPGGSTIFLLTHYFYDCIECVRSLYKWILNGSKR